MKMEPQPDGLRKIVLRKTAKNMGLPETVVEKPKKAMQYTTGVDKTLKRLAKEKETSTKEYLRRILEDRFKRMM
jgi:asparagine synthase (glutamine-hydrolysing)